MAVAIVKATAQFLQEPSVKGKDIVVLMEITMNNLLAEGELDVDDFLSRVDMLGHIGFTVLANRPDAETFGVGSAIYAFVVTLISVFFGGYTFGVIDGVGGRTRQGTREECQRAKARK